MDYKHPFANYYGAAFVLYAMSTPFLNIHWYLDKCNMTGGKAQLINGIALLVTFSGSRLVWGTYQSLKLYQDLVHVLRMPESETKSWPHGSELMRFSGKQVLPVWLTYTYLANNTLLMVLNFYWFWRMIETVTSRFRSPPENKPKLAIE